MRLRPLLSALLIAVAASAAAAQSVDSSVALIRDRYNDIAEKARTAMLDDEVALSGPLAVNELTINSRNKQWRAVGTYSRTFRFFYAGGETERSLYPDKLVFVTTKSSHAATTIYEEFLFSDKGELIFYLRNANGDERPAERRLYFRNSAAIRVIEDNAVRDRLSATDRPAVRDALRSALNVRSVFLGSLKL